jgi:nicotinic acid mononucleotide adenylyltransferase
MYTVEFEKDSSIIRSLDDSGMHEDLEVIIGEDDTVFLRQWQDWKDEHDVMCISYKQLVEIFAALESPEGSFLLNKLMVNQK